MPPDAIATRLRDTLGDREATPKAGVTGQGSERDMTLFVYRPNLANSFQTQLVAALEPDGAGTQITGKIGSPAGSRVFLGCWFGFLTLFLGTIVAGVIASGTFDPGMWPLLAIPVAMMGFGVLLWKLGTWNSAKDEAAILAFLDETVEARAV